MKNFEVFLFRNRATKNWLQEWLITHNVLKSNYHNVLSNTVGPGCNYYNLLLTLSFLSLTTLENMFILRDGMKENSTKDHSKTPT